MNSVGKHGENGDETGFIPRSAGESLDRARHSPGEWAGDG